MNVTKISRFGNIYKFYKFRGHHIVKVSSLLELVDDRGNLLAGKSHSETSVSYADASAQGDLWVVRALSTG